MQNNQSIKPSSGSHVIEMGQNPNNVPAKKSSFLGRVFCDWSQLARIPLAGGVGVLIAGLLENNLILKIVGISSMCFAFAVMDGRVIFLKPYYNLNKAVNKLGDEDNELNNVEGVLGNQLKKINETESELGKDLNLVNLSKEDLAKLLNSKTFEMGQIAEKLSATEKNLASVESSYNKLKEQTLAFIKQLSSLKTKNKILSATEGNFSNDIKKLDEKEDTLIDAVNIFGSLNNDYSNENNKLEQIFKTYEGTIDTLKNKFTQLEVIVEKLTKEIELLKESGETIVKGTSDLQETMNKVNKKLESLNRDDVN